MRFYKFYVLFIAIFNLYPFLLLLYYIQAPHVLPVTR